jgi:hypothetical protein
VFTGVDKCGNCKINPTKPEVCKGYVCLWLAGYGDEEDRPDRSGILADTLHRIDNAVECRPLWEGAVDSVAGMTAIRRISHGTGKPALVAKFRERGMDRVVGRGVL